VTPNEEGNDGSEEPSEGEVMYMGVDLSKGQGLVMDSFVPSGKRGEGGIRDNRLTVDDEKLDVSMSIIECRIK